MLPWTRPPQFDNVQPSAWNPNPTLPEFTAHHTHLPRSAIPLLVTSGKKRPMHSVISVSVHRLVRCKHSSPAWSFRGFESRTGTTNPTVYRIVTFDFESLGVLGKSIPGVGPWTVRWRCSRPHQVRKTDDRLWLSIEYRVSGRREPDGFSGRPSAER